MTGEMWVTLWVGLLGGFWGGRWWAESRRALHDMGRAWSHRKSYRR